MNILQKPEPLSLSMNLKKFIIGAQQSVSFVLYNRNEELLSQSYVPGVNGTIEIDIRDIVHSQLSYQLKDSGQVYEQIGLVSDFKAVIDGTTEIPFRVVRAGVDRLADSATNFLTQNFLTWQPSIKPVTYYSPEFLTYYAVVSGTAKLRAYFTDEAGNETSQKEHTITEVMAGIAYTMPLQYSVVSGWLDHQLPAYYDVWIEDAAGNRLTYIQRYYADAVQSPEEDWVLFENSLGGLDTFRAYGSSTLKAEHTHNLAEIDKDSLEYRVDTSRQYQKNTGHLDRRQSRWLLDFFPSQKKYIYTESYIRQIVVIDSDVTGNLRTLPSSYTFTYKFADARPLLNLPRTDVPADVLNITVPEVGSFTVPPRLAEFSRLSLSEGALFPVQNPYSEQWATTTVDAIGDFLADFLAQGYGYDGGVGHKHRNYSLLELLSYVEGYLLVNGQKIKAGYADKAGSVDGMDDIFLHKDKADRTPFKLAVGDKLTAENGLQIGKSFIPGILTGSGGFFDQFANGELESLIIRRFLEVPELRFNRVLVELGDKWNAPGAGIFESVSPDKDADGNLLMTGTGYLKLEEGEYGAIAVGDICMGIFHSETSSDNAAADSDDSRGNFMFAGFYTTYFTITEITGSNNKQFRYQLRPISERWKLSMHPSSAMHFVSYGSFTDESRQTSQYTTRTYTRMLWKQNTWEISAANIAMQMGDLTNMSIHGLDMTGYSMYVNSVYFTGTIKQVKPDGTPIHTANDRGAWTSREKYDFYDRVSHNGSIWLCINEDGTSAEPADGHADWLKQVDKGQDGMDGVPGPAGADGKSYYTWIRYADDSLGNGISNSPVGKAYIGFAYNKETAVESSDPRDYKWSDIKGEAGVPGAPGADGKPTYTWIAYSDNANGSGMYQQPNDKTQYIGIAVNKNTATEGTNPADYTWSKFKGEQGYSISNAGDWHTGLIVPYLGITRMGGKAWMCKVKAGTTNPPMWTVTDKNGNRILQTQDGGKTYGYILTGEENTEEYQLLASDGLQGLQGMDGTDGIPGTPGKDGATTYFHIKYSAVANPTAAQMSETPNVFIGTYVDFTKEDSTDPAKYTWARFQGLQGAKGEQGVPGIGVDGKTYYLHIKYSNDGGKTFTGNNGEDTGKYIGVFTDLNQNDSNKPSDYKWSLIKGEQGDKGDSVSNVGNWKTGLIVPYLGITRMGGKSWMCKVKAGTTNPPMWTVTDKNGNRILQTQDGGKTYGYILTGGLNATEYELVAADGDPGKDGQDGDKGEPGKDGEKGEQGIQGCILRHSEWKASVEYRNDEGLATGTRYLDVALVRDNSMATGWRAYKCKTTHTSTAANAPGNATYWEEFGLNVTSIFASLIIAKDASIDFMQGNQLLIKKSDGTVTAGLSGSQAGSKVRLWVGAPTPDSAPFRVLESGKIIGTDVEMTGIINAIRGTIGGFEIGNGRIGTVASATGEAGGLSIYDNFFRVGGTDSSFMAGRNVFPSMLGGAFNATVRVTNNIRNSSTAYGFDVANYGLYVEVQNGTKNYALFSPNAVVRATAAYGTQGKLLTINSASYNLDLSQSNVILINCSSQSYTINLPNEKSVCTMFGFSTLPTNFAYLFTIVAYPGTKDFTIPNVRNHNNDNASFDMGQGDSLMLLLTNIGGFRYQLINRQS